MSEQTLEHLRLTHAYIAKQTPKFLTQFGAFLDNQDDPTGLKLSNLRMATQFLKQQYELIDGLLHNMDQQPEGKTNNE
jgi:hypothetical protein